MKEKIFIDTNAFLYLLTDQKDKAAKIENIMNLLENGEKKIKIC